MGRRRRVQLQQRQPRAQSSIPETQPARRKEALLWLFGAAGWLAAALMGVLDLPQKINSFYAEKDQALANLSARFDKTRFVGRWTNDEELHPSRVAYVEDPDAKPATDRGSLQLTIVENSDGSYSGEIVSAKILETTLPWTAVQLEGRIGPLGGFDGAIVEGILGRKTTLGFFKLLPGDEHGDYVEFSAPENFSRIVPTRALLWRTNGEFSGGEPNPRFRQILSENIAKLLEQRREKDATDRTKPFEQTTISADPPTSR